jgi:hypothetical protein
MCMHTNMYLQPLKAKGRRLRDILYPHNEDVDANKPTRLFKNPPRKALFALIYIYTVLPQPTNIRKSQDTILHICHAHNPRCQKE